MMCGVIWRSIPEGAAVAVVVVEEGGDILGGAKVEIDMSFSYRLRLAAWFRDLHYFRRLHSVLWYDCFSLNKSW